jgi:hypothetical protein
MLKHIITSAVTALTLTASGAFAAGGGGAGTSTTIIFRSRAIWDL